MIRFLVYFPVYLAIICPIALSQEGNLTSWEKFTGVKTPAFRFEANIDSSSNSEIDAFVLEKIASLESKYYKNNSPNDYEIWSRIYYPEIPCVEKYGISSLGRSDIYYMLINKCDSSYYHFGGEFKDFSIVINKFFEKELSEKRALGLIDFYLNTSEMTISPHDIFLIPNSEEEIDTLFKRFIDPRSIIEGDSLLFENEIFPRMLKELEMFKNIFKPVKVSRKNDEYWINLFTFNFQKFEFWKFHITKSTMEIIERYDAATFSLDKFE